MWRIRSSLVTAAFVLSLGPGAPSPAHAADRTITYDVSTRGTVAADLGQFSAMAAQTLRDPRGWSLGGGLRFQQVKQGGQFHLQLAAPAQIGAFPGCSASYSCRAGDLVLISDLRWRQATPSWNRSLSEYQHYVINHEVGHWLGLGHRQCLGIGQPAPVMQQQSISLQGCTATLWPLVDERAAVARRFGVRIARPSTASRAAVVRQQGPDLVWLVSDGPTAPRLLRSFVWGRPRSGDVPVVGDWDGDGIDTAGVARPDGRDWLWLLTDRVDAPRLDKVLRWGRPVKGDIPVVGDWNGDGRSTPAVVRPDGRDLRWLATDRLSGPRLAHVWTWGRPGDRPVAGDWDGDRRSTPGVARPAAGQLRWLTTQSPPRTYQDLLWGVAGDDPVPGDWNGDGTDTPGGVRAGARDLRWVWTDRTQSPTPVADFRWGRPTKHDVPVAGAWGQPSVGVHRRPWTGSAVTDRRRPG